MKKNILITGANSGIGKATAMELAKQGNHVILLCRNKVAGESVLKEIIDKTGNQNVDLIIADLASQSSIREFAIDFNQKYSHLDVLINNAAVNLFTRQTTEDGYEKTFAVNHLASFLLTNLLLDKLKAAKNARIVNLTSSAQTTIDFDDLMNEKDYNVMKVYSKSKMANVLFTYELSRRLKNTGITANCLHPGVVKTQLARDSKGIFKVLIFLFYPFFSTTQKGAETSVYLATSSEVEGISGKYFYKKKQIKSAAQSYDEYAAGKLWSISEQLTKIKE